ncbi:membrane-bound lytic murein transglycosylase B [Legionella cherrii]|uniref:Membrane-bound lytic murein transglycosylase B n=1 Tax=Legionella cherrii TaxID=28084 RepID=A0ABY6TAF1_9GAMM|nr:membrane-bound lytic murein transglycosylase B [Legionella cherrii]
MRRVSSLGFIAIILLLFSFSTYSDTAFTQRKDVQLFIKSMVKEYHFNAKELTATMNQVVIRPDIIESMEKPYEKKNWDVYRDLFLTPARLKGGLDYWAANKQALDKAQKNTAFLQKLLLQFWVWKPYMEKNKENIEFSMP